MTGPSINGFTAACTSVLGYGLYALPAFIIAQPFTKKTATKNSCLLAAGAGVLELICLFVVHAQVQSGNVSIGDYASASWDPMGGRTFAILVYIATIVVSLLVYFAAPEIESDPAQSDNVQN